ncbi:hypothetical protein OESDEN_17528 [Oesophagostomum dentatum]|uniref:Uncharacterized protein n=1 Tax=Oesophagostomum dentatum TaxID=61180 RepID=A0A0B1SGW0_OESDE|nr:hypothetical protein OESDEN_17528 [Oesophagostomum dentatum]
MKQLLLVLLVVTLAICERQACNKYYPCPLRSRCRDGYCVGVERGVPFTSCPMYGLTTPLKGCELKSEKDKWNCKRPYWSCKNKQ